jgi:hypothetical protein
MKPNDSLYGVKYSSENNSKTIDVNKLYNNNNNNNINGNENNNNNRSIDKLSYMDKKSPISIIRPTDNLKCY